MKIPEDMTEGQVLTIIARATAGLAQKYKFGFYGVDDIEQECFLFAIDALEKYDGRGPLENFLRVHIKNQLLNLHRNKLCRYEPPCVNCPFFDKNKKKSDNQCTEFVNKMDCKKWADWSNRNAAKTGIMNPTDIYEVDFDSLINDNEVDFNEIKDELDKLIPSDLRADYLRLLDGVKIPAKSKEKILQIIQESNICQNLKLDD
jgi:DNA-directed RNA polymerase specialized sigma24 family protein